MQKLINIRGRGDYALLIGSIFFVNIEIESILVDISIIKIKQDESLIYIY